MSDQDKDPKVLHITNWYPNKWNTFEAPFIREAYHAVRPYLPQELWHIQVRHNGSLFKLHSGSYSSNEHFLILETKIKTWRLIELLTLGLLFLLRIRLGIRDWNLVNVHIAYPLLRYPRLFRFCFGKNIIISEHWSAYRTNFNLPHGSKAKHRIQNIFRHKIPVITVSESLRHDIETFAGISDFSHHVVPNVVDPKFFYPASTQEEPISSTFLMAASWANIKRPLLVLEAFKSLLVDNPQLHLMIIGSGEQLEAITEFVEKNDLQDSIILTGPQPKEFIAEQMRNAMAFVHASEYETFSVVCAEALCSGIPVIASNVGGITELVNENNGVLVNNSVEDWIAALSDFVNSKIAWNSTAISSEMSRRLDPTTVGKQLAQVYRDSTGYDQ